MKPSHFTLPPEFWKTRDRVLAKRYEDGEFADLSACWTWAGATFGNGYGHRQWDGKVRAVHRIAYMLAVGPIPAGLQIDHLCRTLLCFNPNHLEAVTQRENILRGYAPTAINARKTHCKRGHELTEENIYRQKSQPTWRMCDKCRRALGRAKNKRMREENARNNRI